MTRTNVKINVGLNLAQAKMRAKQGKRVRYKDWPEGQVMIYRNGSYQIGDANDIKYIFLDNDQFEHLFSHALTAEYCGCAWEEVTD